MRHCVQAWAGAAPASVHLIFSVTESQVQLEGSMPGRVLARRAQFVRELGAHMWSTFQQVPCVLLATSALIVQDPVARVDCLRAT
jgi:hypothetical protein